MTASTDKEKCILERDVAEAIALDYLRYGDKPPKKSDPLTDIPYSLLSAEHIRDYVLKTGLIAPFHIYGGRNSRLKDAAYEGRIGDVAYQYKSGENYPEIVYSRENGALRVPKNSIVFVECDLDFRLPEFIALRFNLQIKHVHRGLLLGTGPLVDPGYWGKLCIPLHNLTDEDYLIERDDGLIWLEFTKTTSNLQPTDDRIGRPPLGKPFWDIKEFLEKATQPINYAHPRVGIHSAIPSMHDAAVTAARDAERAAKKSSQRSRRTLWAGIISGAIAASAVIIAMVQLTQSYYSDVGGQFREVRSTITDIKVKMNSASSELQAAIDRSESLGGSLSSTQIELNAARARVEEIENRVSSLASRVEQLDQSSSPNNK
ncbi:MAG: hypothetical protein KDD53_09440 [Bdellovibrionales bacterium]|nr:hypothetical protein [Bdellovibrionales bacterium]